MTTKYHKGLSSKRGRALHLLLAKGAMVALCGATITIHDPKPTDLKPSQREICDHCQTQERKLRETK